MMKRFINLILSLLFVLWAYNADATDVNCPQGGEPNLDEIINQMIDIAPEEIDFYEGLSINNCTDLADYEIECWNNGFWRERNGYLSVTAKYAGHSHELYWEHDSFTNGLILSAPSGNQDVEPVELFLTAEDLLFYFKLKDATSGSNWFSKDDLNTDGYRHMVTHRLGNDVFVCGFEDLAMPGGDGDYQDLVFMITHTAPDCIPAIKPISDQSVAAGGSFEPIDLDEAVLDGSYDKAFIDWSWTGPVGGNISVNFTQNGQGRWIATISYPTGWTGEETITFRATTVNGHSFESDSVVFHVAAPDAPVVHDIPDQAIRSGGLFQQIHLDQYVDPPPNFSHSDVDWTWQNRSGSRISVTIENRIATISYPSNWSGSEKIKFTGSINPSGSATATFTVLFPSLGAGVGGVATMTNKLELLFPWLALAVAMILGISIIAVRSYMRKTGK